MNKKQSQSGSIHLIITIVLAVALIGALGFVFYQNYMQPKTDNIKNENQQINNKSYSIGDKISFSGEDWYVITSSDASQDYVTAIKSTYLLNNFAYYHCAAEDVIGEFNDNCARMKSDYNSSYAKYYLENTYLPTLDASKLKDVNGYKVRLITLSELGALGCSSSDRTCENAPIWVQYDGTGSNGTSIYWTMTEATGSSLVSVWNVAHCGSVGAGSACEDGLLTSGTGSTLELRPVINVLKSSIE